MERMEAVPLLQSAESLTAMAPANLMSSCLNLSLSVNKIFTVHSIDNRVQVVGW